MRLTDDIIAMDDERFKGRNICEELAFCGRWVKPRMSMTFDDIRFQAWLCRAALSLIKEQNIRMGHLMSLVGEKDGQETQTVQEKYP